MNRNKKNTVVGIIITVLILIFLVIVSNSKIETWSQLGNPFTSFVNSIQNSMVYLKNKIAGNDSFFINVEEMKTENEDLKRKNSELEQSLRELENIKSENETLKEYLNLTEKYVGNETKYPRYDNFNGIHIDKTKNIPVDYDGAMGVPVTFLHKFNPNQFEIIQFRKGDDGKDLRINGKAPFFRILVKKKTSMSNISKKDLKQLIC